MRFRFVQGLCLLALASFPACSGAPESSGSGSGDDPETCGSCTGGSSGSDSGDGCATGGAGGADNGTDTGTSRIHFPGDVDQKGHAGIRARLRRLPHATVIGSENGVPTILKGNLGSIDFEDDAAKADPRAALAAIAPMLGAEAESLRLAKAHSDRMGGQHFRFRQTANGRDVLDSQIILHVRDGIVREANGRLCPDLRVPKEPLITAGDAEREARDTTVASGATVESAADLAYVCNGVSLDSVYRVDVGGTRDDGTPVLDTVLVSAETGKVVRRIPRVHDELRREVHDAQNGKDLLGPIARAEGDPPAKDEIVNANYDLLGTTYACYKDLFGRDSFDDKGAAMVSTVHFGQSLNNAFWLPGAKRMVYGDGDGKLFGNFAASMDVTAHELTHAVTSSESNLEYDGQSGGLNESMSDVFGAVCEWYRDGKVLSERTWLLGDDVYTPDQPGDAFRYMNDPARDGKSLDDARKAKPSTDVHASSGVSNLAFYLLSEGGSHPRGRTDTVVKGIGFLKAAQVFYQANTELFTEQTNFAEAQTLMQLAAAQLGFSEAEIQSVADAWSAVGAGLPVEPPKVTPLENNVPLRGLSSGVESETYFSLEVPTAGNEVTFRASGGTGSPFLFGLLGSLPSIANFSCASLAIPTEEICVLRDMKPGTYFADLSGSFSDVTLTGSYAPPPPEGHLVINEIDYDSPGRDDKEFVEIWNGTDARVDLSGLSLLFVDGRDGNIYESVPLWGAGSLGAGQYLVVGSRGVEVPYTASKIEFSGSQENRIQNGAPDGVLLYDNLTGHVVDALSYEGSITEAHIPGGGTVNLVEGTALPANVRDSNRVRRSLARFRNGADTDDAAHDWAATPTPTPGSMNLL